MYIGTGATRITSGSRQSATTPFSFEKLTGFLEFLLQDITEIQIITPSNPLERGCQLSLIAKKEAKPLFQFLKEKGVVADWREPDVIRVAPVPMYNTFEDVYRFVEIVKEFYNKV